MSEPLSLEARQKLESLLSDLKFFLGSPIHANFRGSTQRRIAELESDIWDTNYTFGEHEAKLNLVDLIELRAERNHLARHVLTVFEDAIQTLETSLREDLEAGQQNGLKVETENTDEKVS